MNKDTALRLALEYVELVPDDRYSAEHIDQDALITAIKAALSGEAQTRSVVKDEPVSLETVYETIIHWDEDGGKRSRRELARRIVDLYTTPPQRTWIGLTDEEISDCMEMSIQKTCRAIEAKLRSKNHEI